MANSELYEKGWKSAQKYIETLLKGQQSRQSQAQSNTLPSDLKQPKVRKPQIGDEGNPDIQRKEQEEREKNKVNAREVDQDDKGQPNNSSDNDNRDNISQSGDNSNEQGDGNRDNSKKQDAARGEQHDPSGKAETTLTKASDDELEARKKAFAQELEKRRKGNSVESEERQIKIKKDAKRAEKELERYRNNPLVKFAGSLYRFLKSHTTYGLDRSWATPGFANRLDPNILTKGNMVTQSSKIPVINVYFDQSASWGNDAIKAAQSVLALMNKKFVRKNLAKINIWYFSTKVSDNADDVRGGGTALNPVVRHIVETHPDNVIVMTDSDSNGEAFKYNAQVPGMVWFLWRNGLTSTNLKKALIGTRGVEEYNIDKEIADHANINEVSGD